MEHRKYVRQPITLLVKVVLHGQVFSIATVTDISLKGLQIKNPGLSLIQDDLITISFIKPGHPKPLWYHALAKVIYVNLHTIGLSFFIPIPTQTILDASTSIESQLKKIS